MIIWLYFTVAVTFLHSIVTIVRTSLIMGKILTKDKVMVSSIECTCTGIVGQIIKQLTLNIDQRYSSYVDNFYTSSILTTDLFAHNTHITGTLGRTRRDVPK